MPEERLLDESKAAVSPGGTPFFCSACFILDNRSDIRLIREIVLKKLENVHVLFQACESGQSLMVSIFHLGAEPTLKMAVKIKAPHGKPRGALILAGISPPCIIYPRQTFSDP